MLGAVDRHVDGTQYGSRQEKATVVLRHEWKAVGMSLLEVLHHNWELKARMKVRHGAAEAKRTVSTTLHETRRHFLAEELPLRRRNEWLPLGCFLAFCLAVSREVLENKNFFSKDAH